VSHLLSGHFEKTVDSPPQYGRNSFTDRADAADFHGQSIVWPVFIRIIRIIRIIREPIQPWFRRLSKL